MTIAVGRNAYQLTLLHDLGRQLVDHVKRLQVVEELLGLSRAEDAGRDVRVLERPGERNVGDGDALAERGSELGKLLDLAELSLSLLALEALDGLLEEGLSKKKKNIRTSKYNG